MSEGPPTTQHDRLLGSSSSDRIHSGIERFCEDSFNKSHDTLLDITEKTLETLLKEDKYLQDISYDITNEEILAQIAVVKGQSITVYIDRESFAKFKIVIPSAHNTTVLHLKKAIKRNYELDQRRLANRKSKKLLLKKKGEKKKDDFNFANEIETKNSLTINNNNNNHAAPKISWRYIWRTYHLEHNGQRLSVDNQLLSYYGIVNKSVLTFVKKCKK